MNSKGWGGRRPSASMVVAIVALVSSLGGAAYAALVKPNSVNSLSVINGSLRGKDIKDGAVGTSELGSGSVRGKQIRDGAVKTVDIAADAVGALQIVAGAVGGAEIATDAVTALEIAANAIGSEEIADNAVGVSEIATDAVDTEELKNNSVGGSKLRNNAVGPDELAAQPMLAGTAGAATLAQPSGDVPLTPSPLAVADAGCYVISANAAWTAGDALFSIEVDGAAIASESEPATGGAVSLGAIRCLNEGATLTLGYTSTSGSPPPDLQLTAASLQAIRVGDLP
jgi:hypothetical protein